MSSNTSPLQRELNKKHPFESIEQEAHLSILRTASLISAPFEQLFKAHGISDSMYNALRIIRAGGERGRMCNEISQDLVSRVPDVTRLVDRLEKAGLAARMRSVDDRRAIFVHITKRGNDLLAKLDHSVVETHNQILGHMSKSELQSLCELLAKARGIS